MKRSLSLLAIVMSFSLVACNNSNTEQEKGSNEVTEISILMGKPEIASEFEEMLAYYSEENDITVTMIPLAGQDGYEKMTTLYASGNPPTIIQANTEFNEFKENFLDISAIEAVDKAFEGTLDYVSEGDGIYGLPVTVEGSALIYNPEVIDSVFGEEFNIKEIDTLNELDKILTQIEAAGYGGVTLSPMDWSLGAHLTNPMYAAQAKDSEGRLSFIDELKNDEVELINNEVFNGWVDAFDILLKHNIHKENPLATTYEDNAQDLANGDAAIWFQGSWVAPDLEPIKPLDYGFIPVPLNNDESSYSNGRITVGISGYWCIDESASTKEEQKAAIDFLNWFITTEEGQKYFVEKLKFVPAYEGFNIDPELSLNKEVAEKLEKNEIFEDMSRYYPAGGFQVMGASMQKYIDKVIDRDGLAAEFEDYWQSEA